MSSVTWEDAAKVSAQVDEDNKAIRFANAFKVVLEDAIKTGKEKGISGFDMRFHVPVYEDLEAAEALDKIEDLVIRRSRAIRYKERRKKCVCGTENGDLVIRISKGCPPEEAAKQALNAIYGGVE